MLPAFMRLDESIAAVPLDAEVGGVDVQFRDHLRWHGVTQCRPSHSITSSPRASSEWGGETKLLRGRHV